MALATSVTGTGTLTRKANLVRFFIIATQAGKVYKITETKGEEVRVWVALTEAAAEAWVDGTVADGESRSMSEDNRIVGAYSVEQIQQSLTIGHEDVTPS